MPRIFAVDPYATTLEKATQRRNIEVLLQHDLVEIRPEQKEAVFQILETDERKTIQTT